MATAFSLSPRLARAALGSARVSPLSLGVGLTLCALGLALGMATAAPARWLAAGLAQATGQRLVLSDPQGTLWTGHSVLALAPGADASPDAARSLPGRVSWRLRPALAHGWPAIRLSLTQPCCWSGTQEWWVSPSWSGLTIRTPALAAQWPADALTGLGTPWNTLAFSGQLQLSSPALELQVSARALRLQGQMQVQALELASRVSTVSPLGSYRLSVVGGDVVRLELATDRGALQLSGTGQWAAGAPFRFNGKASAAPQEQAALENLLNIIGRRSGPDSLITIG